MNLKHGHCKNKLSKTYIIWRNMIERCIYKNNASYKNYGGRNPPITVCNEWLPKNNGFVNFFKDMGECPKGLTLDRINNNLGYYKENCRWSTTKQQERNRRNNIYITFNNKTQLLLDWAKELDINYKTLYNRIYILKWSIKRAFNKI